MSKASKQLLVFLAATIIWTWAFYTPIAAGGHRPHEMPWMILFIRGGMGPSLIGIGMVFLTCKSGSPPGVIYWLNHLIGNFEALVSSWCKPAPWAVLGAGFAAEDGGLSEVRTKI